ncbi:folliculin isoform X2 [Tachypleus tridentatus]|uniref:folliculin isoform X2 n=1 Tax=Tachypleus tridentatus TaxID=6853 RepID=UPI003FD1CE4C
MNAVVALCHFCELHGPSILFCTQTFRDPEELSWGVKETPVPKPYYGPRELLARVSISGSGDSSLSKCSDTCEGCTSVTSSQRGYICNDHEARVSYISSQFPLHPDVFSIVRQACVRSLSCEVCPGREGPIFFGDDHRGHILSHTFFMKDSQARGFQRWYSIIIVMNDKIFLLNSWQFLVKNLQLIIHELQERANKVYDIEQSENPQRAVRLNSVTRTTPDNFRRQRGNAKARSLQDLTNDKEVFICLHLWFTWLLRAGANRLTERLLEGLPCEDTVVDLERQEETEEGFVEVHTKKVPMSYVKAQTASVSCGITSENDFAPDDSPCVKSLQDLVEVLGKEKFHTLCYNIVIGNQLIFRGKPRSLISSVILCLKDLLPRGCFHPVLNSDIYEDSWKCNVLSLNEDVQIPAHVLSSSLHLCIDVCINSSQKVSSSRNIGDYEFTLHFNGKLPEKIPQVLTEMERAIQNPTFSKSSLETFLFTIKEVWMNKVKVLFTFSRAGQRSSEEANKLLQVLGAYDYDKELLKFWMTGLSMHYKTHVLSASIQQGAGHEGPVY